ncbi:hypothetical protein MNBD_GAMMA26-1328 [hydrothermal vent metagenome]|uniref:PIN domain-containing protein n=1 Tax=hydrothermal vent metagenome TaxID=652676 RepID=A0A3B1B9Z6_9ZZZZ
MILLDTHVLIWMDAGSNKIGPQTRTHIDTALKEDALAVSAISFWELGMLQTKNCISLPPLIQWRRELMEMGLQEIPVTGIEGITANQLNNFHADPTDRLIVATAITSDALVITADRKILEWSGEVRRIDAEK